MSSTNIDKLKCEQAKKDPESGDKDEANELLPSKTSDTQEPIPKDETKKITIMERLRIIKRNITVEPIMTFYTIPSSLTGLAVQNLNLDKACLVNLNFSAEICDALKQRDVANYTYHEEAVQTLIATQYEWKNVVSTVIPVMLILFIGAWSDKTGCRKACILLPIFGEFLACIGYIVNTYFFLELPAEITGLVESILPTITGGSMANSIGVYSYINDITTPEERTKRMGIVNIWMSMIDPIGSFLSGFMLRWVGYYGVFTISAVMYAISLVYGYFYLHDTKRAVKEKTKGNKVMNFLKEFFDLSLVLDTFKLLYEKGTRNRRHRVLLLIVLMIFISGPGYGEETVIYFFTRLKLNWNEMQYSMWSSYTVVIGLLGTAISMTLYTFLKMNDSVLGIVLCASKVAATFAYAFASTDLGIYLAPLADILFGTTYIAMESISSKMIAAEEFGKLSSIYGVVDAVLPLMYVPIYLKVYKATLDILPGAAFLLGGLLMVPPMIVFGMLYFELKKDTFTPEEDEEEEGEEK